MALVQSAVIVTGAAVVTRNRDQLSFPFTARPQAMSIYVRFVETGTLLKGTNQKLLFLGNATVFYQVISNGTFYLASYGNGISSSVTSTAGSTPSVGQRVELLATLSAAGAVTIHQSINEGAVTTASTSAARTLPVTWGAQTLWVNSLSTSNVGMNAFRNIEIAAGVRTMQQMRVLAGTD